MTDITELQYPMAMTVNTTFKRGFRFKDSDDNVLPLAGYSAQVHIREKPGKENAIVLVNSDEENEFGSTLEIDESEDMIKLTLTPEETEDMAEISKDRRAVWDLRVTDPDGVVTVFFRASPFTFKPVSTSEGIS
ncbi:MAG: hypothetical protein ACLFPU_11105 [Dehalococcoidia bacterium]